MDAAAAVGGAPRTPASAGRVGDHHHRRHGRLRRLLFSDLPLVRALPSGTGREAVLDLPMYLSSSENIFIVWQVQGTFVNALSVFKGQKSNMYQYHLHNYVVSVQVLTFVPSLSSVCPVLWQRTWRAALTMAVRQVDPLASTQAANKDSWPARNVHNAAAHPPLHGFEDESRFLLPAGPRTGWGAPPPHQSISTNGANRPTQRPRVHNVWRCHWLSKGRAKTKQVTSRPRA